jgi:hypothetical protein
VAQLLIPHSLDHGPRPRPGAVVEMLSPAPRDIWRGLLRDDPGATARQTPEYLDAVVTATGGTDASRFYQLRDGRQLVLPLVRQRSRIGPPVDRGYPRSYGSAGMLATGGLLADDVRLVVADRPSDSLRLRVGGDPHTSEQWAAGARSGVTEVWRRVAVVDLPGAVPLPPETRQRLRRAARLGVEVEVDSTGRLLPAFYTVYRAWLERRLARPEPPGSVARWRGPRREPYAGIAAVATALGESCQVFVAHFHRRPVAAAILLGHGEHGVVWRRYAIDPLARPVFADLLTQVTVLEHAARSGCRHVDLGPDHLDRDLGSLGASARSVVDLRIEPPGLARLRAVGARAEGVLVRALSGAPAGRPAGRRKP